MSSTAEQQLQHLSLVSKVTTELENHLGLYRWFVAFLTHPSGIADKTLSEFIISLSVGHQHADSFQAALEENGAELPLEFASTLLGIIQRLRQPARNADDRTRAKGMTKELLANRPQSPERQRHRSRSRERNQPATSALPAEPEQYGCYRGRVQSVMDFGCFVELTGFSQKFEGLVHASNILTGNKGQAVKELVRRGQDVWVKVIRKLPARISLSMREVDQNSGKDLLPVRPETSGAGAALIAQGAIKGLSGVVATSEDLTTELARPTKRLSSPERWEARQLIGSGVLSVREYPTFDPENNGPKRDKILRSLP